MANSSEIIIEPFSGDPTLPKIIGALHYVVRMKQRRDGENWQLPDWEVRILESQTDLQAMQSYYVEPGGNFWIAREDPSQAIAGFVGIKRISDEEGELKRLAVLPQFRRQGIASRLVDTAVQWSAEAGMKRLILTTDEREKAIGIYQAFSFVQTGYDETLQDIHMAAELAPAVS